MIPRKFAQLAVVVFSLCFGAGVLTAYSGGGAYEGPITSPISLGAAPAVSSVDLDGYDLICDEDGDSYLRNSRGASGADDELHWYIAGVEEMELSASGVSASAIHTPGTLDVAGATTLDGAVSVGDLTTTGNAVICDAAADTTDIKSQVTTFGDGTAVDPQLCFDGSAHNSCMTYDESADTYALGSP